MCDYVAAEWQVWSLCNQGCRVHPKLTWCIKWVSLRRWIIQRVSCACHDLSNLTQEQKIGMSNTARNVHNYHSTSKSFSIWTVLFPLHLIVVVHIPRISFMYPKQKMCVTAKRKERRKAEENTIKKTRKEGELTENCLNSFFPPSLFLLSLFFFPPHFSFSFLF